MKTAAEQAPANAPCAAAAQRTTVQAKAHDVVLQVRDLAVDIRTHRGTVRAVNSVASRPAPEKPWRCSGNPAAENP